MKNASDCLVKKAERFAEEKHRGQKRRDGTDYVEHPKRVSEIVKNIKKSHKIDELLASSLLHDTLEDTDTDLVEISQNFGNLVAMLVLELTSDKEIAKKIGKTEYLKMKLKDPNKITSWGLVIKLADRLDNISDLNNTSKELRERHILETKSIISELESSRKLTSTHKKLIAKIKNKLNEYKK